MPEHKYSWVEYTEPAEGLYDDAGGKKNGTGGGIEKLQQDRRYNTRDNDRKNKKKQGYHKGHREHG